MPRLYGSVESNSRRIAATAGGSLWLSGHVRGWNEGVRVDARADADGDVFDVYLTGGSNGYRPDVFLGTVRGSEFVLGSKLIYVGPEPQPAAREAT